MFRTTNLALAILWVVTSLLVGGHESAPVEVGNLLGQICDYVRELQNKTHDLLDTYRFEQGSPFNDSGFSTQHLELSGLPRAVVPYRAWRIMSDGERLMKNFEAYSTFQEYFQLVQDDQIELHPGRTGLQALLGQVQADLGHLEAQLASLLAALGLAMPSPGEDPLSLLDSAPSSFHRKLRGFLVCQEYRLWLARTERAFSLLRSKTRPVE